MWDESYTTVEAESRMRARGKSPRESKDIIDAEAAAVILEEWMRENPHDSDEVAEQLDERRDRHDG
jgi:RNase H-fold protein (predicted Holliday junction resolvase)